MALAGVTNPSDTPISSYEIYDEVTNSWTLFPSSPISGNYPGMISNVCGEVFAWGGFNQAGTCTNISYKYVASTNTWEALPNFPIAIAGQAYGQFADGKIIACGGYQTNQYTVTNKTYMAG
jgi:N-acetylneuraminic acid mutarotase